MPAPVDATTHEDAKRIARESFLVFEHKEGSRLVDEKEIPTVVRSMGINPSNTQVAQILQQLKSGQEDESLNLIPVERFEEMITTYALDMKNELIRDDYHKLLRAFRAFDPEGKNFLEAETLRGIVMSCGEAFSSQEAGNMLAACTDATTGRVYYEDLCFALATDGRKI